MNTLKTYKLWLEPSPDIPKFQRLRWTTTDVSIRDVLLNGVHPWGGSDVHYSLPEAVLKAVNGDAVLVPDLVQFNHCYPLSVTHEHAWSKSSKFDRVLKAIHDEVYFVEDLTYFELLGIARTVLAQQWSHSVVRELVRAANPGFQEVRQFLKRKNPELKLSGYDDINNYDLSKVLSLADFEEWDRVIVTHGIETLNFRNTSFLGKITDEQGRLRLVPEIRHVTLTEVLEKLNPLTWRVVRDGSQWRFRPELGESSAKRQRAQEFAAKWGTDNGRLCFTTSIGRIEEMVEQNVVDPSFPSINYGGAETSPTAGVVVEPGRVQAFHIGRYPRTGLTGELLKDILYNYKVSMTGNKEQLIQKLAALAGRKYRERLPELDEFFAQNRFIRMQRSSSDVSELPLLQDLTSLRNLVLTMYAIKHLRGDAILEASHDNDTYTEDELALALVNGTVTLPGAFLRVA